MNAVPILEVRGVTKRFLRRGGSDFVAVQSASISVAPGEILALIGESGSGKSTLGRVALGLIPYDKGAVLFEGRPLEQVFADKRGQFRKSVQPVFQDATSALNPRRLVSDILSQALRLRTNRNHEAESEKLLEQVGLRPGRAFLSRLPHELSGGQRQRLCIARALAPEPRLIIADEPLSGADVSIRGQILNLLLDIREQRGIAIIMITHDVSIARAFADRVAVMQQGRIVETGSPDQVLLNPEHPYTRKLLAAELRLPA